MMATLPLSCGSTRIAHEFCSLTYQREDVSMAAMVGALLFGDGCAAVVVRGDENVNYQKVVQVLDILTRANVTKIGLATDTAGAAK